MKIRCFHCKALINVDNEDYYQCPKCRAQTKAYYKHTDISSDSYWRSFKNNCQYDRLRTEARLAYIFTAFMALPFAVGLLYLAVKGIVGLFGGHI